MFVRVVGEVRLPEESITLNEVLAPEFNVDMLTLLVGRQHLLGHGNRLAVEIVAQRNPRQFEQRGHNIRVARGDVLDSTLWNPWATDEEGDIHILFNVTALPRRQTVLADMEPVVCGVDEICVV
jgi:hypothetical protein